MSEDCNKSEQLPGCASAPRKLTWRELQLTVKHTKAVQQGLANRVPHSFTFCDNKLYFLAVPRSSRENTIHYIDIPEGCSGDGAPSHSYDWKPVVDVASKFASFAGFSREEQLLRERKRLGSIGITSYDFDDTQRKFLFSASGGLFTFTDWRDGEVRRTYMYLYKLNGLLHLITVPLPLPFPDQSRFLGTCLPSPPLCLTLSQLSQPQPKPQA